MGHGTRIGTRRQLLKAIGYAGGSAALYNSMTTLGHAAESQFSGPPVLSGGGHGKSVLVLGAGLAGLLAAHELKKAGYQVQIIEFQNRAGGRSWTLYGGDSYKELGSDTQKVEFQAGNYFNPGPWRIPHHHQTLLHYCRQFGVKLEPFLQHNHNAYVQSTGAFGGKPRRYREIAADFDGNISELLGKAADKGALDGEISQEDIDRLREALRGRGVLDANMRYTSNVRVSHHRGFDRPPGGGRDGAPIPSALTNSLHDILNPLFWRVMSLYTELDMQTTMFQPVGGMAMIAEGFAKQVRELITYNAKVIKIAQDDRRVQVTYSDTVSGAVQFAAADYCVCTIPLGVLGQIETQVTPELNAAIKAVSYSGQLKVALEMRRRFWEEDDDIYGGHSFTDQDINTVSYPNTGMFGSGPAVLLGAYAHDGGSWRMAGMSPKARIEAALTQGSVFHPASYRKEFMNGVSVGWTRVPWTLGGCAIWPEEIRKKHYKTLVALDRRVVLAGEHASYLGCWMEGALLSSIDAITQLHQKVQETHA